MSPQTSIAPVVSQSVTESVDTNRTERTTSQVSAQTVGPITSSPAIALHMIFGVSLTFGVIIFGYLTVNRQFKHRLNKHILCEVSMILTVVSLFGSVFLNDNYANYVLFVIVYGIAIGSFNYTNKILVFSLIRAKNFGKSWSYVQLVKSVAIVVGVPIAGNPELSLLVILCQTMSSLNRLFCF